MAIHAESMEGRSLVMQIERVLEVLAPNATIAYHELILPANEHTILTKTIVDSVNISQPQQDMDVSEDEAMTLMPSPPMEPVGDKGVVDIREFVFIHNNEGFSKSWKVLHWRFNNSNVVFTVGCPQPHLQVEAPTTIDLDTLP